MVNTFIPYRLFFLALIFSGSSAASAQICTSENSVTLRNNKTTIIDYRRSSVSENPLFNPSRLVGGDTVCIYGAQDGRAPGLKIRNFYNAPNLSESNPIRFINAGGQVVLGDNNTDTPVYVQNSRHLILSGTGVEGVTYGFLVDGENISSEGVKLSNRTSHIELDHWEISNVIKIGLHLRGHANCADASPPEGVSYRHVYDLDGDGFAQKGWILGYNFLNQPIYDPGDVDDVLTQNNFTIRNISIHHNYVHDTGTEGMYLGQNMVDHLYRHDGSRGPAMGSKITCRYKNPNLPNDYQP
ncbi:MAG: hypothetical protein P8176_06310, partial [Gammaproteobacteria bacterium]